MLRIIIANILVKHGHVCHISLVSVQCVLFQVITHQDSDDWLSRVPNSQVLHEY